MPEFYTSTRFARHTRTRNSITNYIYIGIIESLEDLYTAIKSFYEDVLKEVEARTRFSFQRNWKLSIDFNINTLEVTIELPFESNQGSMRFTSNVWNNPYFEPILTKNNRNKIEIHQPLQEAFRALGVTTYPDVGTPIPPVKHPKPPEVWLEVNKEELVQAIIDRIQK